MPSVPKTSDLQLRVLISADAARVENGYNYIANERLF